MSRNTIKLISSFVNEINKDIHFLNKHEDHIFDSLKSLHLYLFEETNQWQYLTKLAALYNKRYKKITPEIKELSMKSIVAGENTDAVVYYCLAVVNNELPENARLEINNLKNILKNSDNKVLLYVFIAITYWKEGNYAEYVNYLILFKNKKPDTFNPYITIPVSTAWLYSSPPTLPISDEIALKSLANLKIINPLYQPDYIISVSCDSNYFLIYGKYFIKSLEKLNDNFFCHISVTDQIDHTPSDKRIVISNQKINSKNNIGPISSSLRYLHAYEYINSHNCPIVIMDFDSVITRDLSHLINKYKNKDYLLRILGESLPWQKITAGFGVFYPKLESIKFLSIVRNFLLKSISADQQQWWIDQNALECSRRFCNESDVINIMKEIPAYATIPTGTEDSKLVQMKKAAFLD